MALEILGVIDGHLVLIANNPMPSGTNESRYCEAVLASDRGELAHLIRALIDDDLQGVEVRIDLTALSDGFLDVCLDPGVEEIAEARESARYLHRCAKRIEAWADRNEPADQVSARTGNIGNARAIGDESVGG